MAEENQNEEQETVKIADRRKFNPDGSLREGVVIEEPKTKPTAAAETKQTVAPNVSSADTADVFESSSMMDMSGYAEEDPEQLSAEESEDDDLDAASIPGAENPASFANFLLSLASQAAAAMGMTENPMTGRRSADLELSRYWLDVLGMLREKTKNNLHPQEAKLFDGLLGDLRMQYVQLARAAEAQLKQKAAQKFSGKDILGK